MGPAVAVVVQPQWCRSEGSSGHPAVAMVGLEAVVGPSGIRESNGYMCTAQAHSTPASGIQAQGH